LPARSLPGARRAPGPVAARLERSAGSHRCEASPDGAGTSNLELLVAIGRHFA